eukprot:PDM64553.1 hypothetical protein PRIPAC_52809 [Pristionchus pacificus]
MNECGRKRFDAVDVEGGMNDDEGKDSVECRMGPIRKVNGYETHTKALPMTLEMLSSGCFSAARAAAAAAAASSPSSTMCSPEYQSRDSDGSI